MSIVIHGKRAIFQVSANNVDASFEALQYPVNTQGEQIPIIEDQFNPIRPNTSLTLTLPDTYYSKNGTTNGDTGQVKVISIIGTETFEPNGHNNITPFSSPGTYTYTWTNISGILTWN